MEQVQAVATVTELVGKAFILRANGEKVALQQGDTLLPGTIIMTESGSQVVAQGPDFKLELEEDSLTEIPSQPLAESATNAPAILGTGSDEVAALQAAILDGLDPTQAFEAAAAGIPGAGALPDGTGGDGSGNGGFVTVARTGDALLANAGFDTAVAPLVFDEITDVPDDNLLADADLDAPIVPEIPDPVLTASITIDMIAGDDIINAEEAEGDVTLSGSVGGDVKAGDTVTVTVNGIEYTTTVNPDGTSWNVDVPGGELILDSNVQATVTATDAAGNTATANADRPYGVDTDTPIAENITATGYEDLIGPTVSSGPAQPIEIKLSASDAGGKIEFLVINSLPENGKLYFGTTEITQAMVDAGYQVPVDAGGNADLTFEPTADWSGDTAFEYQAQDSAGNISDTATVNIEVLPVTDIPEVTVTMGQAQAVIETINLSTLGDISDNTGVIKGPGFTITGKTPGFEGDVDSPISVYPSGTTADVSGFGVSGKPITADGDKNEIAPGQSLAIAFDNPVTDFTAQLSWLKNSEYAKYTIYAEDGTTVIGTGIIKGIDDKTNPSFTIKALGGELIGSVVFSAAVKGDVYDGTPIPNNGSDFLIHEITFPTSTYELNISATPTDTDGSESITSITVQAPEGAVLSHGTEGVTADGVTSWTLPLPTVTGGDYTVTKDGAGVTTIASASDPSYVVTIDAAGQKVTIEGVTVTVTGNVPPTVTVIAEAKDGAAATEAGEVESVFVPAVVDEVEVKLTVTASKTPVQEGENLEFTIALEAGAPLKDTVLNFTLGDEPGTQGTADRSDVGTPTVTIKGEPVFVVVNGDGSYSITIPDGITDGIVVSVPTLKDNVLEQLEDLTLNATLTGEAQNGGKLVAVGGGSIEASATGEITDSSLESVTVKAQGLEDTILTIALPETDGSFSYKITGLPDHGTLYVNGVPADISGGGQAVTSGQIVTFVPDLDWSGTVELKYEAVNEVNSDVTPMPNIVINIKPVTDKPTLEISGLDTPITDNIQTINKSNVNLAGKNFTVTTTIDGVETGVITTSIAGNAAGFGVGTVVNTAKKAIDFGEEAKINFEQSVTDLTVQFTELTAGKAAEYTIYDKNGLEIGSGIIDGQPGKISSVVNISDLHPGVEIGSISFTPGNDKGGFYIHEITYQVPGTETYALDIKAATTDTDGSEKITTILVKVAAGVVLSHGKLIEADANGFGIWELSLNSNQGYTVTKTTEGLMSGYEIEGVTVTVPSGDKPDVEVIAVAKDPGAVGNSTSSNDTISDPGNDAPNYIVGTDGFDTINGSDGDDVIFGGAGGDVINGGAGDDIIYGGAGNDTLRGGEGNDTLYGGAGNDTIYGGDGDDIIFGGAGADKLYGGLGDDIIDLGFEDEAIDIVYWTKAEAESGESQNDTIKSFEVGTDLLDISGFLSSDEKDDLGNYLTAADDGSGNTLVKVTSGTGAELNITLEGVGYTGDILENILTADLVAQLP